MKTLCILGRQPGLSLAELESCFGSDAVRALGTQAALIDLPPHQVAQIPLGGTIKIAEVLHTTDANWSAVQASLSKLVMDILHDAPEGKVHLGLSAYGLKVRPNDLQRAGLELKKAIKKLERSVRVVPNKQATLNSAQVIHHKLTSALGIELVFVADRHQTYIARTVHEQDIDDYTARDFARPHRSGFVGMLPPKLAQMMLNNAQVTKVDNVLDPFCGTGVVLQEAALLGCSVYGTDISEQMVRYTRDNLAWLSEQRQLIFERFFELQDATTATWRPGFTKVVCETYLGAPLTHLPSKEELSKIQAECNDLMTSFLKNLHEQIKPGTRCCIAVPAWRTKNGFIRLPVVDRLADLGYNRVSFVHASTQEMIYHRADQTVARELLVLTRK